VSLDGILFCHGSPRSDEEIITALSPEARLAPMLDGVAEAVVVCGHTHHQFDRAVLGRRLVNAGSVGMPYEDEAAAYWLLLDDGEPSLQRTDYDIGAAVERLRATGFPDIDELMLRESLLEPVGSAFVAQHFEERRPRGLIRAWTNPSLHSSPGSSRSSSWSSSRSSPSGSRSARSPAS
jgi:hypothetical protein